jgi:hypothetical protein
MKIYGGVYNSARGAGIVTQGGVCKLFIQPSHPFRDFIHYGIFHPISSRHNDFQIKSALTPASTSAATRIP